MIHTIQQLMDKVSAMHGLAVQLRHSYPPIWNWPTDKNTKVTQENIMLTLLHTWSNRFKLWLGISITTGHLILSW